MILDETQSKMQVLGSMHLWVLTGTYLCREMFTVCKRIAVPYILGFVYLNRNARAKLPMERLMHMKNRFRARLLTARQFTRLSRQGAILKSDNIMRVLIHKTRKQKVGSAL